MLHAKYCQNRPMFHKVIQKNKSGTVFLRHGVHLRLALRQGYESKEDKEWIPVMSMKRES